MKDLSKILLLAFASGAYAGMPVVDTTKNMIPAVGSTELKVKATAEQPLPSPVNGGEFRIGCKSSHMSNDDPLVWPNVPNATHHHTFFGNTFVKYNSDLNKMNTVGASTCTGGTMNRSGYWIPSMIDIRTGTPIPPEYNLVYYKSKLINQTTIIAPPTGLRMLGGNSAGNSPTNAGGKYTCINSVGQNSGWTPHIPNCAIGTKLTAYIEFGNCWDGVNLDSADHKSHMGFSWQQSSLATKCPTLKPVSIPSISFNVFYPKVTETNQTTFWRLASDNYDSAMPGGYSLHGDWVNGWTSEFLQSVVNNCLKKSLNCHAHLLGDGRMFY